MPEVMLYFVLAYRRRARYHASPNRDLRVALWAAWEEARKDFAQLLADRAVLYNGEIDEQDKATYRTLVKAQDRARRRYVAAYNRKHQPTVAAS
jgi:hypothetical protein